MADQEVGDVGRNSYNACMKAIVSEKGQVTIPKAIRDRLGIRPGQVLDLEAEGGRLVGVKRDPVDDPVSRVAGMLGPGRSTDEFMKEIRVSPEV